MKVKTSNTDKLIVGAHLPAHERIMLECAVSIRIEDTVGKVWETLEEVNLLECEGTMEPHIVVAGNHCLARMEQEGLGKLDVFCVIVASLALHEIINARCLPSTEWCAAEVLGVSDWQDADSARMKVQESFLKLLGRYDWSRLNNARKTEA
jgi:hypothetical protein